MSAPLWHHLIFDMTPGKPRFFHHHDSPGRGHGLAEACVDIDERWQIRNTGNLPATLYKLGHCCDADIGQAQIRRHHRAGDVDTIKALAFDHLPAQRIKCTGELQKLSRR